MKDIVIKGKYIVHGIYIFIIFILILLLLAEIYKVRICINPEQSKASSSTPRIVDVGTGRAVQTTKSTTSTTGTASQDNTNSSDDDEEDESEPAPPEEPEVAEPGKIKFTIQDIEHEEKGDDWATLTSITYKIENGMDDFYPIIQVFLFDDNDPSDIKELEQDRIELPLLEEGEVITKESSVHISYNDLHKTKTLRLILRNELGKELKIAVKNYDT